VELRPARRERMRGGETGKSWREDLKFHSSWRFRRTQAALSGCRVSAKHALLSKPCSHPTWPVMSVEQLLYGKKKATRNGPAQGAPNTTIRHLATE